MQIEKDDKLVVQLGYRRGTYKTKWSFSGNNLNQAVFYYRGLNVGLGYKKRLLLLRQGSKPLVVTRVLT
jgi:hypothetical protein